MRKILGRKKIFDGRLIKVYCERQKFPGGYIGDLEVVRHPGAALIVPFLSREKIIMIKQYRPIIDAYLWELPAGTLHKDETLLACAKRELEEETGYTAAQWKEIGFIYPAPGYTTEKIIIFKAEKLKEIKARHEEDELIAAEIVRKNDVVRWFKSGKIMDAKTICALALARIL
jgi:ADP-ribose pyrophosphatase